MKTAAEIAAKFVRGMDYHRNDCERAILALLEHASRQAREEENERCAMLHEMVNPASDRERLDNVPGAGAMGAVIEYRDLIRKSV